MRTHLVTYTLAATALVGGVAHASPPNTDAPRRGEAAAENRRWPMAKRRTRLPGHIRAAVAINHRGEPVRSRNQVIVSKQRVRPGDTLRTIAYRYCTSPLALAHLNELRGVDLNEPLPVGEKLKVPLRVRPSSGFGRGKRLVTGPGVLAKRAHTAWGKPYVIALLQRAFASVHERWPGRHPFVVHDLSAFGGGRLRPHKSHRGGRDIDIGYPTEETDRLHWGRPKLDQIDYPRLWAFIGGLEDKGMLAAVYMAPAIQVRLHRYAKSIGESDERLKPMFQFPCAKGQKQTLIRNAKGHRDHMHLRFSSPVDLPDLRS